jgi:hypothetical protein
MILLLLLPKNQLLRERIPKLPKTPLQKTRNLQMKRRQRGNQSLKKTPNPKMMWRPRAMQSPKKVPKRQHQLVRTPRKMVKPAMMVSAYFLC